MIGFLLVVGAAHGHTAPRRARRRERDPILAGRKLRSIFYSLEARAVVADDFAHVGHFVRPPELDHRQESGRALLAALARLALLAALALRPRLAALAVAPIVARWA